MSSQYRRKNATGKTIVAKKSTKTLIEEAMNMRGTKDDSFDIADSTDWLGTPLSQFADVDSLLRCQVCKDFFTTPMITSCSHTFCSLCIRRCLNNDSKCPTCRSNDQEIKLKPNAAIEDLVEAFKRARPAALELARRPAVESTVTSPKRKREILDLCGLDEQVNKKTRASSRQAARRLESAEAAEASKDVIVMDDGENDADFIPDDGLTACPVCNRRMTAKSVEAHIGRCLAESEAPAQSTSILSKASFSSPGPVKRPDRLPVVNFSLIKDQALKKKLIDLGISAAGGREMMRKRLTEYTTIWNANCDAKHPRGTAQLKRDLDSWERTLGSRAPQPSALSTHIKDKDFDGLAWGEEHKNSFNELIAKAREKIKNKSPEMTGGNSSASTTIPPIPSQDSHGLVPSQNFMKEQEDPITESQGGRANIEINPTPLPQTLLESLEASNPLSPGRFFTASVEQIPDHTMAAIPPSQDEKELPYNADARSAG
ncbi:7636299b-5a21-4a8c-93aa-7f2d6bd87c5e [Sclerotinia trifoliorum]|uniref:Postreplication repair E3 ubiquitin-protein ligase RAD18 n=1 Tax=Sclerotinia trifoliorum TaxID=28548 RepID=A0A8H2W1M9_9HELO|nr:7636299b-5a21-4a8c-93aa-7f2d6bd87c5e [Sclerotinia trifoliorum]